jgi:hypothetical protein
MIIIVARNNVLIDPVDIMPLPYMEMHIDPLFLSQFLIPLATAISFPNYANLLSIVHPEPQSIR